MAQVVDEHYNWRGSQTHSGTSPKMRDTEITVTNQTRDGLFNQIANRPGTAYAEYSGRSKRVTEHGEGYIYTGKEEISISDPHSDTDGRRNKWTGTVTIDLTAYFRVTSL